MWSRLLRVISNREKNSSSDASIFSSKRKITIIILSSVLPVIIGLTLIVIIIVLPLLFVKQYMSDALAESPILYEKINNLLTLNGWCTDSDTNCNKEGTQKYYNKLDEIYNKYKNNGIEIDVELITATIFYSNTQRHDLFQEPEEENQEISEGKIKLGDIDKLASNMINGRSIDYTKYRNYLIDTYIPKRFKDLYEGQVDEKTTIETIADEIMMFKSLEEGKSFGKGRSYISNLCPEICTTGGQCYDLETYVAGVVAGESGMFSSYTPNYKEQWKAQAVAARTYALNKTNWCKNPIGTTDSVQVLNANSPQLEEIKEAISETQGQVITYEGEIFSTEYDSFYLNNNFHCDSEECFATYVKKGPTEALSTESHEIASYTKWRSGFANGHGRGMSQFGAAYLADKGWNYEDILRYYYVDNIQLSYIGGTFAAGEFTDELLFPLGVNTKTGTCVSAGNYYSADNYHGAVDIAGANMGYTNPPTEIPVIASIGGKITRLVTNQWCSDTRFSNDDTRLPKVPGCTGNYLTILVTDKTSIWYNYSFTYFHFDSIDSALEIGQEVEKGQFLGYMGSTGNSTGFHLHYDIKNPDGTHFNSTPVPDYVTTLLESYCNNNIGS